VQSEVSNVPDHRPEAHLSGLPVCSPPQTHRNRNLKNRDFVGTMISNVLRDLPFSGNQPLKSADHSYVRILQIKLIKLKIQEDWRLSVKYNQQDATFSRSIYFYKLLYIFQAVPPPIIRRTKLHIQRQVLSNQAASCYCG